ncbi:MAG: hypothetical protein QME66_02820 [Candidatus Eisenbacteria bacterium]|nr:hypothetical protein [Candidatus Eisenbacteria bacterium]
MKKVQIEVFLILAFFWLVFTLNCDKKTTGPDEDNLPGDYFPLEVGRSWTFSCVIPPAGIAQSPPDTLYAVETWTVVDTAILPPGGTNAFAVRRDYSWGYQKTFYVAKKSNAVVTYDVKRDESPLPILPLPVRVGARFISAAHDTAEIKAVENVSTIAGTFVDCAVVRIGLSSGARAPGKGVRGSSQETEWTLWFAANVGEVKWRVASAAWYELQSYQPH